MIGRSICCCIVSAAVLPVCRDVQGKGMSLANAIEHADAVVVGRLLESRGGTFWEPEEHEGTLLVEQVLKGEIRRIRIELSLPDDWLDYSLSAAARRLWLLIPATAGIVVAAIVNVRRRQKRAWLMLTLSAFVTCVLWAMFLPLLYTVHQCSAWPKSTAVLTARDAVWPLWRSERDKECWKGWPYQLPSSASQDNYLAREEEFARQVEFSSETLAILGKLRGLTSEPRRTRSDHCPVGCHIPARCEDALEPRIARMGADKRALSVIRAHPRNPRSILSGCGRRSR